MLQRPVWLPRRLRAPSSQYWGWRLTGATATDPTSLGCHTDLWRPKEGAFSDLAAALEIDDRLAPVRRPSDVLGPLRDDLATRLGLPQPVPVHCGIHDSNASLLPHLAGREPPFSVVSTGTWVVTFSVGGDLEHLDPDRDTLANVDAFGRAIPSAHVMGGREFEILAEGRGAATPEAVRRVVEGRILFTSSVMPRSGPFPQAKHRTLNASAPLNDDEKHVSASLYAALMTATCVERTGGAVPIPLEGPFARNPLYVESLSKASGRAVIGCSGATGTSLGAAMLDRMSSTFATLPAAPPRSDQVPAAFEDYRAEWVSAASS